MNKDTKAAIESALYFIENRDPYAARRILRRLIGEVGDDPMPVPIPTLKPITSRCRQLTPYPFTEHASEKG